MVISEEKLNDTVKEEIERLLQFHKDEVEHYQDSTVDVAWDIYDGLVKAGIFRIFTVRDGGSLVGYASFVVSPNLHYKQLTQAMPDALYLLPSHRKGLTGYKLLSYAEEQLKGVHSIYQMVHVKNDFSKLLIRRGYELVEEVYTKRL